MIWPYEYGPYVWPILAAAGVLAAPAIYGWSRRRVPGGTLAGVAGSRSGSNIPLGLRSERGEVDAALDAWRHKAADILLSVLAVAFLPVAVLTVAGYSPPVARLPEAAILAAYLVICATALFRRVGYRRRVAVCILALYWVLFVAVFVNPGGPYAQIGVVMFPICALVLLGAPAARLAVMASTAIIVSAPLLVN